MTIVANADPAELSKFGELAHRWWDPEGEFKPLHRMNPLRLEWIASMAKLADAEVLDVGCGGGILSESMARRGARVTGIDLSVKPLKVARLHALEAGVAQLQYREIAAEAMAEEAPGRFDVVTCMEMLEHVPDPASVVRACGRLVRPGGWVFFSTLNRNLKSYLLAVVAAEHVLKLLPAGTHEHARMIQPAELAGFARTAGLAPVAVQGIAYNPFTERFHLEAGADVNYLMACRRVA